MGLILSGQVTNTVTLARVVEWLTRHLEKQNRAKKDKGAAIRDTDWQSRKKEDAIADAFTKTGGSLAATLKRARLLRDGIAMNDVKKRRHENTTEEKKTDRQYFNSWVGNKAKDEYQVDLFFQDLTKQHAMRELLEERALRGGRSSGGESGGCTSSGRSGGSA